MLEDVLPARLMPAMESIKLMYFMLIAVNVVGVVILVKRMLWDVMRFRFGRD